MLITSISSFSRNVFYPSRKEFLFSSYIILSSANAFNLVTSKLLSFGIRLNPTLKMLSICTSLHFCHGVNSFPHDLGSCVAGSGERVRLVIQGSFGSSCTGSSEFFKAVFLIGQDTSEPQRGNGETQERHA